MGRIKYVRLIPDRLESAIKESDMNKLQFGEKCMEIMQELNLRNQSSTGEKQVGNWVSLLLRTDERQTGLNPVILPAVAQLLKVRADWLIGKDDYKTEIDAARAGEEKKRALLEYIRQLEEKNKVENKLTRHLSPKEFKRSPVYGLIKGRISRTVYNAAEDGCGWITLYFKDNPEAPYTITLEKLQSLEAACAESCCGILRNFCPPDPEGRTV